MLEPHNQRWLYALETMVEYEGQLAVTREMQVLTRSNVIDVTSYNMRSDIRAENRGLFEPERRKNLVLPDGLNSESVGFARGLFKDSNRDDRTYIGNVLKHFSEMGFKYTLSPPLLGENGMDEFLFDTRRGFCEHFASAFVYLMRAAGIPSRVVIGYQGGALHPFDDYMIVRQSDAHAWTEVWLPESGWVRVDPTAAVAPERIDAGRTGAMFDGTAAAWGLSAPSRLLHNLVLAWDVANANWNEWILGYGPENQERFLGWLGMDDPDWRKMLLTLVAIVTGLTMLISFALMLRYRPPRKDRAAILYGRFIRKSGLTPATGESPQAFASRVRGETGLPAATVRGITDAYLDARYGPPDPGPLSRLESQVAAL
jgi:hypothetical protein